MTWLSERPPTAQVNPSTLFPPTTRSGSADARRRWTPRREGFRRHAVGGSLWLIARANRRAVTKKSGAPPATPGPLGAPPAPFLVQKICFMSVHPKSTSARGLELVVPTGDVKIAGVFTGLTLSRPSQLLFIWLDRVGARRLALHFLVWSALRSPAAEQFSQVVHATRKERHK